MYEKRAKELIAALRSGEYKQTVGKLRDGDRFCCLGVACELSKVGEWEKIGTEYDGPPGSWDEGYQVRGSDHDKQVLLLPVAVQEYYGFKSVSGNLVVGAVLSTESLAKMNDDGKSFYEIANYIETNWPNL